MKFPRVNYHIHTGFSDGKDDPLNYVKQAIKIKIDEIGFSDHLIILDNLKPSKNSIKPQNLKFYIEEISRIKEEYKDKVKIKCGLEVDYIPSSFKYTWKLLNDYDFDFLILSVHRLGNFHLDALSSKKIWERLSQNEIRKVYFKYFETLQKGVETDVFDIVAHFDIVKKFGYRPKYLPIQSIKNVIKAADIFGIAVEINSSGLRHPVKELYPSMNIVNMLAEYGIPLLIGTDAHSLSYLDYGVDKILGILKENQYFPRKSEKTNLTLFYLTE